MNATVLTARSTSPPSRGDNGATSVPAVQAIQGRTQRLSSAPVTAGIGGTGSYALGTGTFRNVSPGPSYPGAAIYEPQPYIGDLGSMQAQIRQMTLALSEERQQRMLLQAQLSACMRRLDKLDPPETPLRAAVRMVEQRGNIKVSHTTGHVALLRRLDFQPRTTKDEPSAVFRDPDCAEAMCKDLAEISNIFGCPMTIEGHTKGGESDFWQTLANRRARIVAETMIDFGANPSLLHTQGLPGRLGKNEVRTEVHMDISNINDENAPVQEIDIVVGGRVVERDFVQAGHVVERDTIKAPVVMERDITIGGRVVERDLYLQAPQIERELVGMSGKTVERQHLQGYRPVSPRTIVRRQ